MLPSNKFQKIGTFWQSISQVFQRVSNQISPHLISLKTTINCKFVDRFICLKVPNLVMLHRILGLTPTLLQFFLFALKYNLEQIVTAYQIWIKMLFGQNYTFLQYLLIHHFLFCLKDHSQLLQRLSQEQTFGFGQNEPILQSREDVDCLIVFFIEMIGDVSAMAVSSVSCNQYFRSGQFVVDSTISGDMIDPVELPQEKRVGVHPHSAILVNEHHSQNISSKLDQFVLGKLHQFIDGTDVDVFGDGLLGEKSHLPAAF